MDILNNIFSLDVLYKNNQLEKILNKDICISIPFNKFTFNPNHIPNDYNSYLTIKLIYMYDTYIILDCILNISNNGLVYIFEFEYFWNFVFNEYKFKNNYYQIDYFVGYIKDSVNEHNNIKLTGSVFNKLIFNSNYPILGNI